MRFETTYNDLCSMLPRLKEEASKGRWKNVKPENFQLIGDDDCALIRLEYIDEPFYSMKFQVGMTADGFAADFADNDMDMSYQFLNQSRTEKERVYFDKEHGSMLRLATYILDILFQHNAMFFHAEDGFYINTGREHAFQKYCFMLDCMLPIKDEYETSDLMITSDLIEQKNHIQDSLGTDFEIVENQETDHLFTHGRYL